MAASAASDRDAEERRAPAGERGEIGAGRNADDRRQRHAAIDQRDRPAAPLGGKERGGEGDRGRHERAGGKREQRARRGEAREVRRDGGDEIGEGEGGDGDDQQPLALDAGGRHRDQRRAEGVGEGEDRHQRAGRRRRDVEVGGDLRQHAGDQERLGADGEGAEDEGKKTEHGRVLDQFNGSLNWVPPGRIQ